MKRINPLETGNNPAPIPGCHTSEGCCSQYCGPLDFTFQLTDSPGVMTTEVLEIRSGFSHPPKLAKPSATKISEGQDLDSPVGSIPFGKRVRGVTLRGKVLSTTDCQQGLSPKYPRERDV